MQKKTLIVGAAAAALTLAAATGCGGSSKTSTGGVAGAEKTQSSTLVGAGSTFVAPLMTQWQSDYASKHNSTVTYGAIGSGGGIAAITGRTVDFGASDAPLTAGQQQACKGCVQIPWALGGTALFYNLPGLKANLRIDGPTLARIFLGQIKTWNDPALKRLNPGQQLPATQISVVHRSDGSGTTYNLTDYLSHVSGAWKSQVGTGTAVSWPTGSGAPHSSGVAAAVKQTPGAIGYAEAAYALSNHLSYFSIRNEAGKYVAPTNQTVAAAAQKAHFASDNSVSIVDPPASEGTAYPISTFTYVIVPRSSSKLAALKPFMTYAVTDGQSFAAKLDFAPLPQNVVAKDKRIIKGL